MLYFSFSLPALGEVLERTLHVLRLGLLVKANLRLLRYDMRSSIRQDKPIFNLVFLFAPQRRRE